MRTPGTRFIRIVLVHINKISSKYRISVYGLQTCVASQHVLEFARSHGHARLPPSLPPSLPYLAPSLPCQYRGCYQAVAMLASSLAHTSSLSSK